MTEHVLAQTVADGVKIDIRGECAPDFQPVLDAFVQNFRDRRELGASYCVYHRGKKVVDLWAGHRDPARTQLWTGDTLSSMQSVVKGMLAMGLHMLADQGRISYDAPVAQYWPQFAQNGKEKITVRQAISHHAAIHFCDAAEPGDYFRLDRFLAAVAKQKPEWEPGTRGAYHTVVIYAILGHLIQLVSGQRPWDYMREQITQRLGIDYHYRMGPAELARFSADCETDGFLGEPPAPPEVMARFLKPIRSFADLCGGPTDEEPAGTPPKWYGGNARAVARMFAFAAMDGELDSVRIFSPRTIDLMSEVQWEAPCAVWGSPFCIALGLMANSPFCYFGPNPKAFGTAGAGGSFAMADRENRLSAGYNINRWWPALALGERASTLVDATYASL